MKCHVCAAAGVLMLAGPAFTRWVQDPEVTTVSVAPTEGTAENEGVAAVLNRIFRSPVTEPERVPASLTAVQDEGELERELAELERELAERTREETERQFEEVLRQLELTEGENARPQDEDLSHVLEDAEHARTLAERALEQALTQLEQAEDARGRAVEEATLADEILELERAETGREALEQALAQREVEFHQRDVRAEYKRALGALGRGEMQRARRAFETQRDHSAELKAALELARTSLAETQPELDRVTRWSAALERLGRHSKGSRVRENAISAWRSALQQGDQSELVKRLESLDRRLAELGAEGEAAEHQGTCNHCDACRALHAERGAHTAPEPSRSRARGRAGLPREPRAPRAPREPREPKAPRAPREPRETRSSFSRPGPRAGLPTPGPRPTYSRLAPLRTPSTGESGCCCCNTCPRCGASAAPKGDAKAKTGSVSGLYSTRRAFAAPAPTEFGIFADPPSATWPEVSVDFPAPTFSAYSFGTWATPETADDPCDVEDDPDDEDAQRLLVGGPFGNAWKAYNLAGTVNPLMDPFGQAYVLKSCSDGECGEKECIKCNAARWPGVEYDTKNGVTYLFTGQGSGKGLVYSVGKDDDDDDRDEDDQDVYFNWKTGAGNWFVTQSPGEGLVYSIGEDGQFNWKPWTGNWFAGKGQGTGYSFISDDDELGGHGEVLAEILELMEEMSIHLEELRGDVRGLREEVGSYSEKVERRLPGAGAR